MFGKKKEEPVEEPVYKKMKSLTYTKRNEILMEAFINKDTYENMTHKEFDELQKQVISDFNRACASFQENVLNILRTKYPSLHFERYVDHGRG